MMHKSPGLAVGVDHGEVDLKSVLTAQLVSPAAEGKRSGMRRVVLVPCD